MKQTFEIEHRESRPLCADEIRGAMYEDYGPHITVTEITEEKCKVCGDTLTCFCYGCARKFVKVDPAAEITEPEKCEFECCEKRSINECPYCGKPIEVRDGNV